MLHSQWRHLTNRLVSTRNVTHGLCKQTPLPDHSRQQKTRSETNCRWTRRILSTHLSPAFLVNWRQRNLQFDCTNGNTARWHDGKRRRSLRSLSLGRQVLTKAFATSPRSSYQLSMCFDHVFKQILQLRKLTDITGSPFYFTASYYITFKYTNFLLTNTF